MKTQLVTLYIYAPDHTDRHVVTTSDMSEYGWILLGTDTVLVTIPDTNPVEAELNALAKQKARVQSDYGKAMSSIERRENELKALEHDDGK